MSKSVWFEEVDTALLKKIQSVVKVRDSDGSLVPVPVSVRKPEEDFKIEQYPCMTIYNMYSQFDKIRSDDNIEVVVDRDFDKHTMTLERPAQPYNLYYQIDFWSKYQLDMNQMTRTWLASTGRDFNLDVLDMSGEKRSSFVLMTDSLKKSDLLSGNERIYHSMISYRIYVELDEEIRREESMTSSIDIKVNRVN